MSDFVDIEVYEDVSLVEIEVAEDVSLYDVEVCEVGIPGPGVPPGGVAGYHLVKKTNDDFNTEWVIIPTPSAAGVTGSVQFNDVGVTAGDAVFRYDKDKQAVIIGNPESLPDNPLSVGKGVDSYLQVNVQNTSDGTEASSDYVATADNGSDEAFYIDMGINGSNYGVPDFEAFHANDGYVIVEGGDLQLCSTKDNIRLVVGGTLEENVVGSITPDGLSLVAGTSMDIGGTPVALVTNRPEILYGTDETPPSVGIQEGTIYFQYT